MKWILAHELTHLILTENLGVRGHFASAWLVEGLAKILASAFAPLPEQPDDRWWHGPPDRPLSFGEMMHGSARFDDAEDGHGRWHRQSGYMAWFIILKCGMKGMKELLHAMADLPIGGKFDDALKVSCGGRWARMADLEKEWFGVGVSSDTSRVSTEPAQVARPFPQ